MTRSRIWYLIKYYFNFKLRKRNLELEKQERYRTKNVDELNIELGLTKSKYKLHSKISSFLTKFVAFLVGASFLTLLFKFCAAFSKTIPQLKSLTSSEVQFALTELAIFLLVFFVIVGLFLFWYGRYVNDIERDKEMIERILKEKGESLINE